MEIFINIIGEKKGYILHEVGEGNVLLCRILHEYDSKDEARSDLAEILTGGITEDELPKKD